MISAGLVEVPPNRIPGGIQMIDYGVGKALSERFVVTMTSPRYPPLRGKTKDGRLILEYVMHPAINRSSKVSALRLFIEALGLVNYSLLSTLELLKSRATGKIDCLIVSDKVSGLLPILAGKVLRSKIVFSEGNVYPWYTPLHFRPSRASQVFNLATGLLTCRLCDVIRTQSADIKRGIERWRIPSKKLTVISGGVDTTLFKPSPPPRMKTGLAMVGYVGRLTDEKGAPLLLQLVKLTKGESWIRFTIAGTGHYLDEFRGLPNVVAVGNVAHEQLPNVINSCDVMVAPHGDLSLTIIEEMSCGRPVVALDTDDTRQAIAHMHNGILCPPDPSCFLDSIRMLFSNPEISRRIGEGARRTALDSYSWEAIGKKWVGLVQRVLDSQV